MKTNHQVPIDGSSKSVREPKRVRLPGFVSDTDIGLGDVIKRATYTLGVKPCGGCERRASTLNRLVTFTGRKSR